MSLLVVGCGYVGRAVAELWQQRRERVLALTRGGDAAQQLAARGIVPMVANWLDAITPWPWPDDLPPPRVALVAVPHRVEPGLDVETHVTGLRALLHQLPSLERIVVLSTTGVYHQHDGSLVDEDSPVEPSRIGPQIALAAERWLARECEPGRAVSLRLAGIYGPERVPLVAKLRAGEAIPSGAGWLNLIHQRDIARAIMGLFDHAKPRNLYVLSDGQPVERRQFYVDAARIFKTPAPVFSEVDQQSSRGARSESNKRINPQRILADLQLELEYPNHLVGLAAIAAGAD